MTDEASVAVRGVLAASPGASIVVCDAHAGLRNLLPERLDRFCTLLRGQPRSHGMMTGLDGNVDAACLIGSREAEAAVPGITTVEVKQAFGNRAAESLHPAEACARIEAGAQHAFRNPPGLEKPTLEGLDLIEVFVALAAGV